MKEYPDEKIHLALAFDEKFLTPFYVLLTSVFHNNRKRTIVIHTIATGIRDDEKKRIADFVQENSGEIFFYDINKSHEVESLYIPDVESSPFTKAIFYRFYFPFLVPPAVKKLLYLDVDIVVIGDLSQLYHTDISPYPAGAVVDPAVYIFDFGPEVLAKLGIEGKDNYFNSGVLLIDVAQWKVQKISEKAIYLLTNNHEIIKFPDQDALNIVLKNNWYKLSKKYNLSFADAHIESPINAILPGVVIIHYTTAKNKPWNALGKNKLRHIYHYYLKKSATTDKTKYVDFEWTKKCINAFFRIRLIELYFEYPVLRRLWKILKR